MTPERLRALVEGGETLAVEFKSEASVPLPDRELVENVVCLANRSDDGPGWLLIGIEDDGRVSGARPRHEAGRTDPLRVQALIANRTRPSLSTRAEVVPCNERDVLVIEVLSARQPIGTADGRYLRRALGGDGKPCCIPFHFHEMQGQQGDHGLLDYSRLQLSGLGMDALDPLEFDRYRRMIRENRHRGDGALLDLDDLELARALGAVECRNGATEIRVLGLLLFGHADALVAVLPAHEVAFQVLSGTDVEVNDFFRWPLLRVMEELETRFRARTYEREIQMGMTRIGIPNYAMRAFRESVANALIHRDYTRLGAVYVQWREDRIDIFNPGGFPQGVRLDNLLVTEPRPRNPLLADAFKRAGIVERTARGIDTIFYEQLRCGRAMPSYARSTTTSVALTLPGGEPHLGFVRLVASAGRKDDAPLSLDELLILHAFQRERHLNLSLAAATIQKGADDAEALLHKLRDRGIVETRGSARRATFQLSEAIRLRLDDQADERSSNVNAIPHAQLVRQYAETHGSVSRRDVADICALELAPAYRLLKKMVSDGVLQRRGASGRGVRYVIKRD